MRFSHRRVQLAEAQAFYERFHRHSDPLNRHIFSLGIGERETHGLSINRNPSNDGYSFQRLDELFAIGSAGQPSSPRFNQPHIVEIKRICARPDAPTNTVSCLLGHMVRAVWAMGYQAAITYTRPWESGDSLHAAGWVANYVSDIKPDKYDINVNGTVRWYQIRGLEFTKEDKSYSRRLVHCANADHQRAKDDIENRWEERYWSDDEDAA